MVSHLIKQLPKVELHVHIEGSMEPTTLLYLAEKNKVKLPYKDLDELEKSYQFKNLGQFMDLYIQSTQVIQSAEDFYLLTMAYLQSCHRQNIKHTEIFCDIRTYTDRGFAAAMVIEGIAAGFAEGQKQFGISGGMIPCFIRHLGIEAAIADWQLLKPHRQHFLAVGLAAKEVGFPPSMFKSVFQEIRNCGLKTVAHAGEEGDAGYIWSAIEDLKVSRIDHGVRCLEDKTLVNYLAEKQIPLTVCPCSNVALKVVDKISAHMLPELLAAGLNVSIHSDDPALFAADLTQNMEQVHAHCNISERQIITMTQNAIDACFASANRKAQLHEMLKTFLTAS